MTLPPVGARASTLAQRTWILGISPSARARRIAAEHGASRISDGAVVVPTGRARKVATALKGAGVLAYAEPDVRRRRASSMDGFPDQWARGAVVPPDLLAPPLGLAAIGVIDDQVDMTHGDLAGHTVFVGGSTIAGPHGTMVASAASATGGNGGVMGVFPSVPIMSYGTSDLSCSDIVRGVDALVEREVDVINISLGSPSPCVAEFVAIEQAVGEGIIVVAAAGNEYQTGNPVEFPAAYPHVLSVASVRPDLAPSGFSNANTAIDVAAPGEDVPVAIPLAHDVEDGAQDGVTSASGTSFAAPIVAGVAAWLRSLRTGLAGSQVADVLRSGAADLGPRGWDQDTGWGLVSVTGAIQQPDPPIDPLEDPNDVYRIRMPRHSALRATLRPRYGDPDLFAYRGGARSLASRRAIVDLSVRAHGPDRVYLVNTRRRKAYGYLAVRSAPDARTIDSRYTLIIRRTG
jgi:subtilisin family serine protease